MESSRQVAVDLIVVFAIIFVTDVLVADFFPQFDFLVILLWAFLPFAVELSVRKGTVRNIGFQKTNFRRSIPLYLLLVIVWVLVFGVAMLLHGTTSLFNEWFPSFLLVFFDPAFVEELNFRGFLQTRLEKISPLNWSIVIQATVFGLFHLPAVFSKNNDFIIVGGVFYPLLAFLLGIVLGVIFAKTRNLFVTMSIHGSLMATFLLISVLFSIKPF